MNATHPESLKTFFATEMWERYGFYVVQTLLALYLAMHLQWDDDHVYFLVGSFTALTYLSPVLGGWIADHLMGQKRCILIGTAILFFSYLILGFIHSEQGLTMALAGIAIGTGLLKPNISSLLGNEYPLDAPNRERGFTIFYMGITTGIILGTTLPSYIQSHWNWKVSFLSAAFGMIIAGTVFSYGIYRYRIEDYTRYTHRSRDLLYSFILMILIGVGAYYVLHSNTLADTLFFVVGIFSIGYIGITATKGNKEEAEKTLVIGLLCVISMIFWAFYFQMFQSLTLLLNRLVQPTIFGIPFPPPYYVAIQSLGMIILGIFLGKNNQPGTIQERSIRIGNKFLLSMIGITGAYLLITLICYCSHTNTLLSPLYFIPTYLMISFAELTLSPVGLSAITMLSSPKRVSTMMGIFFVSLGLGGFLSGKLAILTAIPQAVLKTSTIMQLKQHYANTLSHLLLLLIITTFFCWILNQVIKRLMR